MKKNLSIMLIIVILICLILSVSILSSQDYLTSNTLEEKINGTYIWDEPSMSEDNYRYTMHYDKNHIYYMVDEQDSISPMGYWFTTGIPSYEKGGNPKPMLVLADILLENLLYDEYSGPIEFFSVRNNGFDEDSWNMSFSGNVSRDGVYYIYARAIANLSKSSEQISRGNLTVKNEELPDKVQSLEKQFNGKFFSWQEPLWEGGFEESTIYFYDDHRYTRYKPSEESSGNEIITEGYWIFSQTIPMLFSEDEEEGNPILILFRYQISTLEHGKNAGEVEFFSIESHPISGYQISLIGFYDGDGKLKPRQRGIIHLQKTEG
jgi:hypothetical protein